MSTTSRIDEIRGRLAAVNWRARTAQDRDIEYLLVIVAEAEDRFSRIQQRECELSNRPGVYECRHDQPCLGCALRLAENARDHNAQGWHQMNELLQQVNRPCRRCELSQCPDRCMCPCHRDEQGEPQKLDPDATYAPPPQYEAQVSQYQARNASYPPPPPPPKPQSHRR